MWVWKRPARGVLNESRTNGLFPFPHFGLCTSRYGIIIDLYRKVGVAADAAAASIDDTKPVKLHSPSPGETTILNDDTWRKRDMAKIGTVLLVVPVCVDKAFLCMSTTIIFSSAPAAVVLLTHRHRQVNIRIRSSRKLHYYVASRFSTES